MTSVTDWEPVDDSYPPDIEYTVKDSWPKHCICKDCDWGEPAVWGFWAHKDSEHYGLKVAYCYKHGAWKSADERVFLVSPGADAASAVSEFLSGLA